jgi:hypothetical protein
MSHRERAQARALERALHFEQCPSCTLDFVTREGEQACHYYACPYLPDLLDIVCPACNYNFATGEGAAHCGDPPSCDYALEEAPAHVAALEEWVRRHNARASSTPTGGVSTPSD